MAAQRKGGDGCTARSLYRVIFSYLILCLFLYLLRIYFYTYACFIFVYNSVSRRLYGLPGMIYTDVCYTVCLTSVFTYPLPAVFPVCFVY